MRWLEEGKSPTEVAHWTRETYPGDKSKQLDHPFLYKMREKYFPELSRKGKRAIKESERERRKKDKDYKKREAENRLKKAMGVAQDVLDIPDSPYTQEEVDKDIQQRLKRRHVEDATDEDLERDDIGQRIMRLTGREPPPPEPRRHIKDEQLLRWVNGVDGFAQFVEDMIMERGMHITLQDYQREMAQAFMDHTRVVINSGGQIGKDMMIMSYSIWLALMNPGSSQLILCHTQSQSVALMDRTIENINMDEELAASIINIARKPEYVIYFGNGSRIYYLTASSHIAGKTNILCAWINEARDIQEAEVTRVSPLLGVAGGKLYVLSRPRFRQGYFWDIYQECMNNPRFKAMKIPTVMNKYFDRQVYEDDKSTLSPDLFKIEYLAEFSDAGSSYFSEDAINKCSKAEYDYKGMNPEPEYEYSVGIDWARLRDTCVIMVIGKRKKQMKGEPDFKLFHTFSFSPEGGEASTFDHHFAYLQLLDNKFQFRHIMPESSGMGIPLSDRLRETWNRERRAGIVNPYENRSLQSKLEMYEYTKHIIESGNIIIPRNADRLINELKMTQFGATLHGTLRIETPITDDYADALCLSLMAWKKPFEIGISTVHLPGLNTESLIRQPR